MSSVSFFQAKPIACPICEEEFKREVLRTGGGRIIAGDLSLDLRRQYKPSPKYGVVNPLIYTVVVCPHCYYAALPEDFAKVKEKNREQLKDSSDKRRRYAEMVFDQFSDFNQERDTLAGAISFLLAISSYTHFSKEFAPSIKKAICSIRCSWLIKDLIKEDRMENLDTVYVYMRHLAWQLYEKAIKTAETGAETFDNAKKLGPDVDTDYGYDGALYVMSLLGIEQSEFLSEEDRKKKFTYYRSSLSKVFGLGKSSKSKPSAILDIAKDLHTDLGKTIGEMD